MILFLDFDDTLFNTKRFNQSLGEHLINIYGLADDVFQKTHELVKNKGSYESGYYDFNEHVKMFSEYTSINSKEVWDNIFKFARENTNKHIFSDVPKFLDEYKNHDNFLVTMTFGGNEYQSCKIKNSGIAHYFKDVSYTSGEPKSCVIKKYLDKFPRVSKSVFLDDRGGWLAEAVKENPGLIPVHMKRKDGRYHEDNYNYSTVADMAEFARLLAAF